jgi:hypothetical protein
MGDRRLERAYRRLLVFYPGRYRRVHAEEMLAVLMTAAPAGKRRPGLAEAADLIIGGLRVRCQPVRGGVAGPGWRGLLALTGAGALLGLLAGAGYAVASQPMSAASTIVVVPAPATRDVAAQAVIADSEPVLSMVMRLKVDPGTSLQTLRSRIRVTILTNNAFMITARGASAVEAIRTANAVAYSYMLYYSRSPGGSRKTVPRLLDRAALLPATPLQTEALATGGLGALCGALLGAITAVALSPPIRRFRMT